MMKALLPALAIVCAAITALRAQQPVGEWDFKAQAESIRDRSSNRNDLRVEGCQWVQSKPGTALRVPARSARIWCEIPGEALRPTNALGLIAWVRPLGTGQYCAVVRHGKGWGEESTAGYRLLVYLDGVRFLLRAGRIINISGGRIIRGQWNQVAATYNGKEAVAFINGQVVVRDLVEGPIVYAGVQNVFEVGSADGGNLDGEITSLKVFNRVLSEAEVAADWDAGKSIRLAPDEITAERYAKLERCSLTNLPDTPFMRDRHTTLLAHMEANCDADYSRWEGGAGGWRLKNGVPGRFGFAVELPTANKNESGAPILYRGAGNCDMRRGTCEFWMRAPDGVDLLAEDKDRYLLTIIPEFHLGYGKRPGVHLVMRTHAATRSIQFAANTDPIDWYSHLNGGWIADSAKTTLHLPRSVLAGSSWHHVLCSWSMEGEGRIWLLVDGKGITTRLAIAPDPGPPIPCYKIFLGGSYFPEVYCPAACLSAIGDAADALFLLYDLTADDNYLAPLRECADWGLNLPAEHKGYLYYDAETGEPITAKGYKVYRFSDPAFKSAFPYRTSTDYFNRLQQQIKLRSSGPLIPGHQGPTPRRDFGRSAITIERVAAGLEAARSATEKPLAHLAAFKRRAFPAGNILNEHPRHGRHFWPGHGAPEVQRVLDYIHSAKVAAMEMDATTLPRYTDDYFGFIDPARDWHTTPLMREVP